MKKEFKKRLYGKWVLSGEYSVLYSGSALVYPLSYYYIDFLYKSSKKDLHINKTGLHQLGLDFSVAPLLDKALQIIKKDRKQLKGTLTIKSFIPFGAGLGASAILCTGIASLFLQKKWILKKNFLNFAISLEHFFHGKSSGMDINSVLTKKPILYKKGKKIQILPKFKTKPMLFLSYSGGCASTSFGVSKVMKNFQQNKSQAKKIDQSMKQSVHLCLEALKEKNQEKCKLLLKKALLLGKECFYSWNLISYDLETHIKYLETKGALAVKPTGSGLGGHTISLWDSSPPASLKKQLIPLEV